MTSRKSETERLWIWTGDTCTCLYFAKIKKNGSENSKKKLKKYRGRTDWPVLNPDIFYLYLVRLSPTRICGVSAYLPTYTLIKAGVPLREIWQQRGRISVVTGCRKGVRGCYGRGSVKYWGKASTSKRIAEKEGEKRKVISVGSRQKVSYMDYKKTDCYITWLLVNLQVYECTDSEKKRTRFLIYGL